jgi:PPP family 3-phenylpropionic acid transporter
MKQKRFYIKNATIAFSLIEMLYWMSPGLVGGYVSIYLLDQNYTNTQIGFIIAIAGILSAVFQPAVATYADKPKSLSLKIILSIVLFIFIGLVLGMIFAYDRAHILTGILFCTCMLIRSFLNPLINSLGTETMNQGGKVNFGAARGMGSVAYATISFVLGQIVASYGVHTVNYAFIIFAVLFILVLIFYPYEKNAKLKKVKEGREASNPIIFFSKYKSLGIVMVGCVFLYVSQGFLHNFFFQELQSVGGGSSELGVGMAISALFELPSMFGLVLLLKYFKSGTLVMISGLFYALKATVLFMATSVGWFYFAQTLQFGCWALITVSCVMYVNSVVESADSIKGQAYMSMTYTLGSVIGATIGGILIDFGGVRMMLACAIMTSLIGTLIIFTGLRKSKKSQC